MTISHSWRKVISFVLAFHGTFLLDLDCCLSHWCPYSFSRASGSILVVPSSGSIVSHAKSQQPFSLWVGASGCLKTVSSRTSCPHVKLRSGTRLPSCYPRQLSAMRTPVSKQESHFSNGKQAWDEEFIQKQQRTHQHSRDKDRSDTISIIAAASVGSLLGVRGLEGRRDAELLHVDGG